jgi:hypothetical protein
MTNAFFKKSTLFCSIIFVFMLFQACDALGVRATGDDQTRTFNESDFHGLDLCVPANVEVRVDSVYKIEITCEETAMPYVETRVSGGILKIYFERNVFDVDNMKIVVSAPSWDHFDVSGSGDVVIEDAIFGDDLRLDISGSGSIKAYDAVFNSADFDVSGSGDLKLAGSADDLHGDISGSGTANCLDFPVQTAHLKVSGSGNMKVNVLEKLVAEISGSGDIEYEGNPDLTVDISGSGKVRKH